MVNVMNLNVTFSLFNTVSEIATFPAPSPPLLLTGYKLAFNYLKGKRYVDAIDVCHKVEFVYVLNTLSTVATLFYLTEFKF